MTLLNGAQILVKSLEDLDVKVVFGIPGGAIVPVYDELWKSHQHGKILPVINANEQCSGFCAAGYSRSSNKVGVAIVTSGPAVTNILTSVADSYFDSQPMLVFTGQVPEHKIGTDAFQHIGVEGIYGVASKKVVQFLNGDLERLIKDSYHLTRSGKPGPVIIDFPVNRQNTLTEYKGLDPERFRRKYESNNTLCKAQCEHFFDLLQRARKPMLYIGGGLNTQEGSRLIREFNNIFQIPYVNTLMAKGVMDDKSHLSLGMLGMFGTPYANMAIQETDFFIVIGARWDDRVAEKVGLFGPQAKVAYIDINQEKVQQIREERNAEFTFIGDAVYALKDVIIYAKTLRIKIDIPEWRERVAELKRRWPLDFNRNSEYIQTAEVAEVLSKYLDEDTIVTTGVGNHQMLAAQYLATTSPKSFLTSGAFGTMGFALPTSIGACFANPNKKIIVVDGDGSMSMNEGELRTVMEYGLPIKIIVINNSGFEMVRNLQDVLYGKGSYSGTMRQYDTNYARIAEAHGFSLASRITQRNGLEPAIKTLLQEEGAGLLEVMTDVDEVLYPKVPPGKTYHDMILGPYIQERE